MVSVGGLGFEALVLVEGKLEAGPKSPNKQSKHQVIYLHMHIYIIYVKYYTHT